MPMVYYKWDRETDETIPVENSTGLGGEFQSDRTVKKDSTPNGDVSTVFLVIDHARGQGDPILFETMVFGGPYDEHQRRYHTAAEARVGHEEVLRMVKGPLNLGPIR